MAAECAWMRTRHTRHTPNTAYISSWMYLYLRIFTSSNRYISMWYFACVLGSWVSAPFLILYEYGGCIRICIRIWDMICIRMSVMLIMSDRAYTSAYGSLYIYGLRILEIDRSTSQKSIQSNRLWARRSLLLKTLFSPHNLSEPQKPSRSEKLNTIEQSHYV